ncbi:MULTISPECIES: aspartate ammonia-lyase [Bacillus]|jgi:aspartate ammonia-lyase|uniref:Aspartate ammonia-lyase n=3 Tax=Bacillus subtilis subsp. subtilis TaxID=135461 RepID=ASPA_BACSU|nr:MULTISPECIES: aspartate ammonia-lyase [Bacillales]NP_390238.2 L-aspartase (aspartate ammonia lyase) [Bacillus subtilis subsp. subtilis str. 168]P26899.2 RecName: Full=Aspartate ammonia-lyase; Short=Aspartase [Bacillus subtilis subsp. subtilis str. 168]AOL30111.1 aspartate ammonia-lyase [Alkalicoccobacillus gibsonii]MDP4122178.1 aspartate ammonia-lyase [Bacillota bacterium]WJD90835.1 aspartate ammonia-lyase [Bacillus spizizenii]BAM52841.1 aspartate ammonia-lyase [Bacillus subtilis BEST7613]
MLNGQKEYRVEKDFLGEKQIEADVYYGIQTLRASENFPITGYKIHEEMINALAIVKKAAALANMDVKRLYEGIGQAIVQAADEILEGKWHDQFIVDPIQGGAGTSMNMNANEVIGNRALEIMGHKKGDYIHLSPNTHVNMSQSTNDVFPTAIHISTLKLLEKLLKTMEDMHSVFKQKAQEFDSVIKMGRTHLQDAVPIRLGQEFEAYSRVLERDIKRIKQSRQHLYEVNMGATAVGTGLNADPEYIKQVVKHLADISGLPLVGADHLVDATQNTDAYTEVSASLKVCMMNMSKIANDLRLMASGPRAGLAEISLPARQPGSSIMPGKVNPVMAELINQIAFQVIGNDNTICLASEAGQLELNVMEPVLVFNLLQSISIMNNGFRSFTDNCLKGIEANEKRMKQYVEKSAGVITAVNPHLGYEAAARIAREAIMTGQSVRDLCLQHDVLTEEELDIILNPYEMTKPGIAGKELLEK